MSAIHVSMGAFSCLSRSLTSTTLSSLSSLLVMHTASPPDWDGTVTERSAGAAI